ncbi:MAG: HlyD family efflux transporter periplasmic adaptor subunit, partial [bacterium]
MSKKKRLIAAALGALAVILVAAIILGRQGVAVETAAVKESRITRTVMANGYFAAASEKELVARDPLVIQEVLVEAGDQVREGQVLIVIDTAGLEAERKAAMAELTAIDTQQATLEATLPLQQAQAESQVVAAEKSLEQAEQEAKAMTELYEAGAVSEMDWRRAGSSLAAAKAQAQTAKSHLAQIRSQAALINQYREQAKALSSRLSLLEEKLDYYQMKATEAGQVVEVYVQAGDVVGAGTPLLILTGPDLVVKAEVLAQDAPELAMRQEAIISGDVLGDGELIGIVDKIHPRAVEKLSELGVLQRRVPVEITLEKRPTDMRPGYPVEVEIITAETTGLALPLEAVFTLDGADKVFVIKNGRAVLTSVEI